MNEELIWPKPPRPTSTGQTYNEPHQKQTETVLLLRVIDSSSKATGENPMEGRLSALEEKVDGVQSSLGELRSDFRDFRAEVGEEFRSVRSEMDGLRTDSWSKFKITWAGLLTGALVLLGAMATGFMWVINLISP